MPRPKSDVVRALKTKGFEEASGDHIFLIYYTADGLKTGIRTKTSHSPKMRDIPDVLLSEMAKQCKLQKGEFLKFVDCNLSRRDYEGLLRERKLL